MSAPWSEVEAALADLADGCSDLYHEDALAVLRPLWDRQAEALAEAEKRAAETEADVRARLLMEMTEERMRSALGDTAFERDAAQAGEVIQRTLAQHFERERDKARASLAAAEARQGELRRALADLLSYATSTEGNGAPEDPIGNAAKLLAAPAPEPGGLLAVVELEERNAKTHRQAGHYRAAHVLERFARRLRAAVGLLPREESTP